MRNQPWTRIAAAALGFLALVLMGAAQADPPARVGQLSYISGATSFSPAGEDEWFIARINRPIITGDRLWADNNALAELQIGTASVRLAPNTSVTTLNLDDRVAQFQLAQGALNVHVRSLRRDEVFEIDTPNLAFSVRRPGHYRIDVDPDGRATSIAVRSGSAEVFGEGVAYVLDPGQWYRFYGTRLEQSEVGALPRPDSFDRWSDARDRRYAGSASARYVAPEMIGYEDLDEHGTWRVVAQYGNVWVPRSVPTGWAPYRYGHWAWIDPWGWTWVDDAPWGFAPFHYGRWAIIGGTWGWVPGPVSVRPVYAPALVVFVGGSDFRLSLAIGGAVAGVAWFPLAPGEVYRPAYTVSRTYFTNVNVSNTTISNTYVTNIYNNPSSATQIRYANRQVAAAVTAVPTAAFAQSQPVARAAATVSRDALAKAPIVEAAPVAPSRASVTGAAPAAASRPSATVLTRPAVAKVEPPPAPASFTAKQSALAAHPGKPLAERDKSAVKAQPAREAPRVTVVKPSPAAQPVPKGATPADTQRRAPAASVAQPGATAPEAPQAPAPPAAPRPPGASDEKVQPPARERREPQPPRPGVTQPEERAQPPAAGPKAEPTPGARPPESRVEEQRRARPTPRPPESGREEAGARPAPAPRPPDAARDEQRRTPPAARPPEERRQEERATPPAPRPAETRREEPRGAPAAARPPQPRKEEQRAAPPEPPAGRQPGSRKEEQPRTTPGAPPPPRRRRRPSGRASAKNAKGTRRSRKRRTDPPVRLDVACGVEAKGSGDIPGRPPDRRQKT